MPADKLQSATRDAALWGDFRHQRRQLPPRVIVTDKETGNHAKSKM
jgi:hypothetical protein